MGAGDWRSLIGVPQCLDCLDLMRQIPDGAVKAIITDPPFGTKTRKWDKEPPEETWSEFQRICPNGPIAVMAYPAHLIRWSRFFDLKLIGYIVWHKYNEPVVSPGLTRVHQDIAIWGKSMRQIDSTKVREPYGNKHLAKWHNSHGGQYEVSHGVGKRLSNKKKGRHPDGRRCSDLWAIPAPGAGFNSHLRKHPNQKPDELLDKLTRLLTDEDDLVLDPFGGSFTTARVCQRLNRRWISGDINPEYVERARAELAQPQQVAMEMGRA